ncbi:MAG: ATP12 family protein [Kiloniellales bacterium]|nr:ATP12 family protein [Kiloniellales bacterium]
MVAATPLKRFFKEARAAAREGGYGVQLDGRDIRTPGKAALVLPSAGLAEAVAGEWAAQGARIEPATMPLMSLACTAIDQVAPNRGAVIGELVGYGESDLLCYRAEHPEALVARQAEIWQPLLDWAARNLDAPLRVTCGIRYQPQPEDALAALRRNVEALDDFPLTALDCATRASGSLVIALALHRGRLDAEAAFEAAELDATFQIELWGEDPEATRRRAAILADLAAARRLMELLSD